MKKKRAILNLSNASNAVVILKANTIVSKMTGNANFTAPLPALAAINTQVALLNQKITEQKNAFQTYQQKTIEVNTEHDNLLNLLEAEGNYVSNIANGDEAKILSAGFDIRKAPVPVGLLPAPKKVLALEGANDGEINGTWDKVSGAKSYIVEMTATIDQPDSWEHVITVTNTKCTLKELSSGSRVWIRVAAINAAGQGAYSDPATKTVP